MKTNSECIEIIKGRLTEKRFIHSLNVAESAKELAIKFQVKKAPTLFVPTEEGYDVFDNVSDIKKYIEGLK